MSLPIPTTLESLPINPPSPPEEPPGVRRGSYGLFDTPKRAVLHSNDSMVCGTVDLTKGIPPACRGDILVGQDQGTNWNSKVGVTRVAKVSDAPCGSRTPGRRPSRPADCVCA